MFIVVAVVRYNKGEINYFTSFSVHLTMYSVDIYLSSDKELLVLP